MSCFVWWGCTTPPSSFTIDSATHTFSIGNDVLGLILPESWKEITPPDRTDAIFMAHDGSSNIVILHKQGSVTNVGPTLLEQETEDLYYFNPKDTSFDIWSFEAKSNPTSSLRYFWQKAFDLSEQNIFLIATCSVIVPGQENSACPAILDSWGKMVDKTEE